MSQTAIRRIAILPVATAALEPALVAWGSPSDAPGNVQATQGGASIRITWAAVEGATLYGINSGNCSNSFLRGVYHHKPRRQGMQQGRLLTRLGSCRDTKVGGGA